MMPPSALNILFIINPFSGSKKNTDWQSTIQAYFETLPHQIEFFIFTGADDTASIKKSIKKCSAHRVVAVGGDGTISLVATILQGTHIPMGILRGGSANGMATELKIPENPREALDIIVSDNIKNCDGININNNDFCIHLSDVGMNAQLIKYFDESKFRGMWNYARMLVKAMVNKSLIRAHIKADGMDRSLKAYMIVIGNASKYGSGAVINPDATLDDGKFELVIIRKIALSEFIKLFWNYQTFNPGKVEIFKTSHAVITTKKKVHFQVDGEYKGKVKKVTAAILPGALKLLINK